MHSKYRLAECSRGTVAGARPCAARISSVNLPRARSRLACPFLHFLRQPESSGSMTSPCTPNSIAWLRTVFWHVRSGPCAAACCGSNAAHAALHVCAQGHNLHAGQASCTQCQTRHNLRTNDYSARRAFGPNSTFLPSCAAAAHFTPPLAPATGPRCSICPSKTHYHLPAAFQSEPLSLSSHRAS